IASVLTSEPPLLSVGSSPPAFDRVIRKCLAKDRDARWQTARDLRDELAWLSGAGSAEFPAPALLARKRSVRPAWWTAAAAAVLSAIPGYVLYPREKADPPRVVRFSVPAPENTEFPEGDYPTVSPDGESIAFHARATGQKKHQIWLFRLSTGQASPIPGSEEASVRYWSDDGQSLAIWRDGHYRLVDISTGSSSPIPEDIRSSFVLGRNDYLFSTETGIFR